MPSTAEIFGAALLHSLGKGIEGVGEGRKNYRDYAMKKLLHEDSIKPSMQKNVEYFKGLPREDKQTALDLATASGGGTVTYTDSGLKKTPAPPQPHVPTDAEKAKKRTQELLVKTNRTPEENKELGALLTVY
jgi:hypothetical protein